MTSRKDLDGTAAGLMLLLCLVWGAQQVVLKAAAVDVAPLMMIALRSGIAAVVVFALMRLGGERLDLRDGTLRPGLLVGGLFALEYLLVGEGLRHTSASRMVVFLYTAPVFAALGLHWKLPEERLTAIQWLGVGSAFVGIAIAFLGRTDPVSALAHAAGTLWGDLLGLLAGAAWGATTVAIRGSSLALASAKQTLLYQLVVAFVALLAAAILLGQMSFSPTPLALASLAFQSLAVSVASFLVWFWLLRRYVASRLGVFSFATPIFGVLLGAWLLDEPIGATFVAGAALVLLGVGLVTGRDWLASGRMDARWRAVGGEK